MRKNYRVKEKIFILNKIFSIKKIKNKKKRPNFCNLFQPIRSKIISLLELANR